MIRLRRKKRINLEIENKKRRQNISGLEENSRRRIDHSMLGLSDEGRRRRNYKMQQSKCFFFFVIFLIWGFKEYSLCHKYVSM